VIPDTRYQILSIKDIVADTGDETGYWILDTTRYQIPCVPDTGDSDILEMGTVAADAGALYCTLSHVI